ncbi:MAG: hypothetical protein ACSHX0_05625 [Akkermansiaceae bacterium]
MQKRSIQCLLAVLFLLPMFVTAQLLPVDEEVKVDVMESELLGEYWIPKKIEQGGIDLSHLSITDLEREDYARNLGAVAIIRIHESRGEQKALNFASKVIGLALHLSPRNKVCLVANAQLARGIMPARVIADYDAKVLASLLLTRGQLLETEDGESNTLLARYFISLSAMIDPRNEDAVFEAEIRRIDHGEAKWQLVTGRG